jgi:hypothetical protein
MSMTSAGIHPLARHRKNNGSIPTPWSVDCWSVFVEDEQQLSEAVRYVERHPEKEGLAKQEWDFVVPTEAAKKCHRCN